MRLKIYCTILLFLSISLFNAQNYPDLNQYFIFLDAKTQDIKIIESDSIVYTNGFQNPTKLIKSDYPETLYSYQYNYNIHQKNYFVNNGGGVVLEYENNHIKRIDQSFLHKNQYSASYFAYKNEMYLFGGYGLFIDKNILTKYDFKSKEWFLVPYNSIERPIQGSKYENIVIGNDLYLFGGGHQSEIGIGASYNNPNLLWKFNFKDRIWKNLGTIHLKHIPSAHEYGINNFILGDKMYILAAEYSAIIDIKNNKITYYKSPLTITDQKVIYNPKNNTFNYLVNLSSNRKTIFISTKVEDFFKEPIETETFYEEPFSITKGITYSSFALLLLLPFGVWYYRKKGKTAPLQLNEKETVLVYSALENIFTQNDYLVHDLTSLEHSVLSFLIQNNGEYKPIHDINFIIENEIKTSSINTVLRKRESLLHLLKSKLSILLNIPYEEVILEQKSKQDRRIKEIKLNCKYFKTID